MTALFIPDHLQIPIQRTCCWCGSSYCSLGGIAIDLPFIGFTETMKLLVKLQGMVIINKIQNLKRRLAYHYQSA